MFGAASRSTTWFRNRWRGKSRSPASTGDTLNPSDREPFPTLTSLEQARRIADLAQEKLARDVLILDMRPVCSYTDYFVVCTGNNPRQAKAIYDEVREGMKREVRLVPRHVHGERDASWILADYLDVVLHVFTPEARAYYRLEELWGDVPSVEVAATAN
ncbi:MAG TPA: ribosome silencing factor [Gaiellaceae bacterium]